MALQFKYDKLMKDYINIFSKELKIALKAWEVEVETHIMSNFIKKHGNPQVNSYVEETENAVIGFLEANPAVLADSFGTGSLMNIIDNPDFKEYFLNKGKEEGQWNPLRHGKKIVGRPEGNYIDIFGIPRHSTGDKAGIVIERKN